MEGNAYAHTPLTPRQAPVIPRIAMLEMSRGKLCGAANKIDIIITRDKLRPNVIRQSID